MKPLLPVGVVVLAFLVTACSSPSDRKPSVTMPTSPQVQTLFEAPTVIQAPTIANDSPGQSWNFPNDPATVIKNVHKWLSTATLTTVQLPKTNQNLRFMDYIGPSELYFTNQNGDRIVVAPAFYIAHGNHGYYPSLIKNVITYKDGNDVYYLKSPKLFEWLGNDKNWESQFRVESYTNSDPKAISNAKTSKWGGVGTSMFPTIPGIDKQQIQHGGPAPIKGSSVTPLPGTVESLVDQQGPNRKVTFIEVWNNGMGQYRLTYVVSPTGTILSHTQSGDTPPQDWR